MISKKHLKKSSNVLLLFRILYYYISTKEVQKMATSTITVEFKVNNKKTAKKICNVLESKSVETNPTKSRGVKSISELLEIIKK